MAYSGMFIIRVNKAVVGLPIISENYRAFFNYPDYLSFKGFRLSGFYNFNPYSPVSLPYAENRKLVFGSSADMEMLRELNLMMKQIENIPSLPQTELTAPEEHPRQRITLELVRHCLGRST